MGDGLNLMDRTSGYFSSFPYQPEKPAQLSRPFIINGGYWDNHYEQVQFIHEDWEQKLWIGSFDSGLNIYDPLSNKQIHFTDGSNGLETRNIWNIFETKDRAIFICTGGDGGGKNYRVKIKKQLFSFYSVAPDANIDNIIEDKNRQIWLGGNLEDWQFNPIDKSLSTLPTDLKKKLLITELNSTNKHLSNLFPDLIRQFGLPIFGENASEYAQKLGKPRPDLFIRCVKKDKSGNIWIGTWGDGLLCYNALTKTFKSYKNVPKESASIGGNHISAIYEDRNGHIWVGGGKEIKHVNFPFFLDRIDIKADTFVHYYLPNSEDGYPANISEDKAGNLWYPTVLGGIHQLNPNTKVVTKYNQSNSQIPSEDIRALVIAPDDHIWMSTEKTLVRLSPDRQSFIEYGALEGIKIDQFLYGSGYISSDNTLYFGGIGGFHCFDPAKVLQKEKLAPPKILLTEVAINKPGSNEAAESLSKSILLNEELNLAYDENTFSIGFTLLDYQAPEKVYLEYQLEGQDRDWQVADNKKTAQYYNLPTGDYLFKVRGANSRGLWNTKGQQLKICIHPPWYQTTWAYLLFFSLLSGLLYKGYQFQLTRALAIQEAEKLASLDQAKTRLYTNITHEFRTPLTVILGMNHWLTSYFKDKNNPKEQKATSIIQNNSHQLLGLINQMLDLAKLVVYA